MNLTEQAPVNLTIVRPVHVVVFVAVLYRKCSPQRHLPISTELVISLQRASQNPQSTTEMTKLAASSLADAVRSKDIAEVQNMLDNPLIDPNLILPGGGTALGLFLFP